MSILIGRETNSPSPRQGKEQQNLERLGEGSSQEETHVSYYDVGSCLNYRTQPSVVH